MNVSVQRAHNG